MDKPTPINAEMEAISQRLQTSSENQLTRSDASTPQGPTSDDLEAIYKLLTRIRLVNGWMPKTFAELEPQILITFEQFARYKIPDDYYRQLLNRAIDVRQAAIREHGVEKAPPLDLALLLSCWTGPHGMQAALEADRGTLTSHAKSQCPRCFGTGKEYIYDIDGTPLGVRPGCDHRELVETEWLFKDLKRKEEEQKRKEAAHAII